MKARRGRVLSDAELRAWLEELLRGGRSVAIPVEEDGIRFLRVVEDPSNFDLREGKTRWSPKEHLFPRSETLYAYARADGSVHLHEPSPSDAELVLLGHRPCDAAGLARLDDVFLRDPADALYARRRAHTTVVTVACAEPGPECFCTAVGGSPAGEEGSDALLRPIGERWLIHAVTAKGEKLLAEQEPAWPEATQDDWQRADERRRKAEAAITAKPLTAGTARQLERAFDDAMWEQLGQRCLGCSICAYVCPSCTCFDVHQQGDARRGEQLRCWDACTYALFTRHASGHNPRPDRAARYRQRLLHKFAYAGGGRRGRLRCVGCGRCTALCPAGIDIQQAVHEAVAAAERMSDGAGG